MADGIPDWAATLFGILTGDSWPSTDETKLLHLASTWEASSHDFLTMGEAVRSASDAILSSGLLQGQAADELRSVVDELTSGDYLPQLAQAFSELGTGLRGAAQQIDYTKIVIVLELAILAIQIAYLVAMAWATWGASLVPAVALQVAGRELAISLFRKLVASLVTSELLQVGIDVAAQVTQIAQGHKSWSDWSGDTTRSAFVTGIVGGVLGPLGHSVVGKRLESLAERRFANEALAKLVSETAEGALHETGTDALSNLALEGKLSATWWDLSAGALDEATMTAAGLLRGRGAAARHQALSIGEDVVVPDIGRLSGTLDRLRGRLLGVTVPDVPVDGVTTTPDARTSPAPPAPVVRVRTAPGGTTSPTDVPTFTPAADPAPPVHQTTSSASGPAAGPGRFTSGTLRIDPDGTITAPQAG